MQTEHEHIASHIYPRYSQHLVIGGDERAWLEMIGALVIHFSVYRRTIPSSFITCQARDI